MKRLVYIATAVVTGLVTVLIVPIFVSGLDLPYLLAIFVAGTAVGAVVTPWLVIRPVRWFVRQAMSIPPRDLLVTLVGAFIGLIFAALLYLPLSSLPNPLNEFAPITASIILAVAMGAVFWSQQHAASSFLPKFLRGSASTTGASSTDEYLLDTSAIIDGRIADIAEVGFLSGTVMIPRFVLNELQHIADSPDPLRRARGRRGLDVLNRLQKDGHVVTEILDDEVGEVIDVDSKLIVLGKRRGVPVVTNDFNLNRVAEIQGVRILNVNTLANAVKTVVLPGEEMALQIIQEGKEVGQGVGFLDDGTMVVVENGKRYLNRSIEVTVTRVLTTAAGRMIFASPKNGSDLPAAPTRGDRQAS